VNIAHTEADYDKVAKTCGCKDTTRKVTYSFVESYHSLCIDKKDTILSKRSWDPAGTIDENINGPY